MHRRLAAGELHGHLPARLDLRGVVQDFLNLFPAQSSWTYPTWLASMKQGSHIMLQRLVRSTVSTEPRPYARCSSRGCAGFVVVGGMSRPGKFCFDPVQELRVDGHHVFIVAVDGALLHHPDLAVALDDLRLDLADLLVNQVAPILLAVDDRSRASFTQPGHRESVCAASRAWAWTSPTTSAAAYRTTSGERRIRIVLVEMLDRVESDAGRLAQAPSRMISKLDCPP
jgi:hypothetical protein